MSLRVIPAEPRQGPDEIWLRQIFDSKAARSGQVVRRKTHDVESKIGWHHFICELERRGFHAVENCGQVVIFCNNAPVRVLR